MSELFNEVFGGPDTSKQTPIEVALGVDEKGMTTATKLYDFLELNPSNYAKWLKKNILENKFAEETVDYWVFVPKDENSLGGRPTQDAKLTASFAKKLSMISKSPKGEAARNYFVGIENGAKKLVENQGKQIPITEHPGEVARYLREMDRRMEKEGVPPYKIAEAFKMVSEQYGIRLQMIL